MRGVFVSFIFFSRELVVWEVVVPGVMLIVDGKVGFLISCWGVYPCGRGDQVMGSWVGRGFLIYVLMGLFLVLLVLGF